MKPRTFAFSLDDEIRACLRSLAWIEGPATPVIVDRLYSAQVPL